MIDPYDQTHCPKCGWMFCPGYWHEGVCRADMQFCGEPTSDGDEVARCVRVYYEAHRETWLQRHSIGGVWDGAGVHADEFMLGLIGEVYRVQQERDRRALTRQRGKDATS